MSLNGSLIEKRTLYGRLSTGGRGGGTSLPPSEANQFLITDEDNRLAWEDLEVLLTKEEAAQLYILKSEMPSDEEMTIEMAECDIIQPVASPSGKLFINNEGKIYIF